MFKEIYIIRNKINSMVYIGQAKNSQLRWAGHCSSARHSSRPQIIDQAMRDLGIENFWYEVLESVEDYDDRERYWIATYNCVFPNGYNKLPGGDGSNTGTGSANGLIRDDQVLDAIIQDIQNSDLPLTKIAEKYNLDKRIITAINRGISYRQDHLTYPLRKRKTETITNEQVTKIIDELIQSRKSFRTLAAENNVTPYFITQVNIGKKFYNEQYTYPLRIDFRAAEVAEVKKLLRTTDLSMRKIGELCNISYTMVNHINIGKYYFSENESYPIRQTK